jgi:hypothetical protein
MAAWDGWVAIATEFGSAYDVAGLTTPPFAHIPASQPFAMPPCGTTVLAVADGREGCVLRRDESWFAERSCARIHGS